MISGMFLELVSLLEIKTTLWQVGVIKKWGTSQLSKWESTGRLFKCDIQYTCIFKFWIPHVMLIITPSSLTYIDPLGLCLSLSIYKPASAGGETRLIMWFNLLCGCKVEEVNVVFCFFPVEESLGPEDVMLWLRDCSENLIKISPTFCLGYVSQKNAYRTLWFQTTHSRSTNCPLTSVWEIIF